MIYLSYHRTKIEEAIEHGTIIANAKMRQVFCVATGLDVVRRDALQELDVFVAVESQHVLCAGSANEKEACRVIHSKWHNDDHPVVGPNV